jgi:hypothetical protein
LETIKLSRYNKKVAAGVKNEVKQWDYVPTFEVSVGERVRMCGRPHPHNGIIATETVDRVLTDGEEALCSQQ